MVNENNILTLPDGITREDAAFVMRARAQKQFDEAFQRVNQVWHDGGEMRSDMENLLAATELAVLEMRQRLSEYMAFSEIVNAAGFTPTPTRTEGAKDHARDENY